MDQNELRKIIQETISTVHEQIKKEIKEICKPPFSTPQLVYSVAGFDLPPYPEMVRDLFKKDPSNVTMTMHAAIGLAGESGELRSATSNKNAVEECGDLYFYSEAMAQRLSPYPANQVVELTEVVDSAYYKPNHATALDNIHIITCEILDLAKKSWVYGYYLNELQIACQLELLRINLDYYVTEVLGTTIEDCLELNQEKLLKGRYKSGKYSDEQALNRADKHDSNPDPRG